MAIVALGSLITEKTIDELTQGAGEFSVRLERPQEALTLLKRQPWASTAYIDESGSLITTAPDSQGCNLNLFLVNAGFVPESLAPATRDLEQIFLQLTNSGSGDVK